MIRGLSDMEFAGKLIFGLASLSFSLVDELNRQKIAGQRYEEIIKARKLRKMNNFAISRKENDNYRNLKGRYKH